MVSRRLTFLALAAVLGLPAIPSVAEAQTDALRRIGRRAARTVEGTISNHVAAKIAGATRCALDDTECAEEARENGERAVYVDEDGNIITDADGNPITDPEDARAAQEGPGTEVWRNYDFVPGSRVIYALDLSDEPVGRWPANQLEFGRGVGQVVEFNGAPAVEFTDRSWFRVELPEVLPDDFTVEIGYKGGTVNMPLQAAIDLPDGVTPTSRRAERDYIVLAGRSGVFRESSDVSATAGLTHVSTEVIPFALQVDGDSDQDGDNNDYTILYAGTERVAQVPNAAFKRGDNLVIHVRANARFPSYITHLVVAVHGEPLYDALTTGERAFTTRGILFDFDSDRLRGESTPTLQDLVETLQAHPDLEVAIEGHTDAAGEDEYNSELSERRAQAVVDFLVNAGVERSRLQAVGFGESQPIADNGTEAGRQQNRRVVVRNLAEPQ